MMKFVRNNLPIIIALPIFWLVIYFLFSLSLSQTNGNFTYSIDDAYIHLSLAKHFILNNTIGINSGEFAFCSSSPLWTSILIGSFSLFGINTLLPFILNIIIASLSILFSYSILNKKIKSRLLLSLILLLLIFGTPMHALVFIGLEHNLHILLTIIFIYLSSELIIDKKRFTEIGKNFLVLLIIAFFLPATRYEGYFLVFIVSCFLFYRRKILGGMLLLFSGFLPILITGMYSMSKGWFFLPNSILLKGNFPQGGILKFVKSIFYTFYPNLAESGHLVVVFTLLAVCLILIYSKVRRISNKPLVLILLVLLTFVLHLQFASVGWFYRYEAYLVFAGLLFSAYSLPEISTLYREKFHYFTDTKIKAGLVIIFFLALSPVINRGVESFNRIPKASKNIYEQQVMTTQFLSKYYSSSSIAMHDIGAVSFYSNVKIVDLWGLANLETAKAKLSGGFNATAISKILNNNKTEIAVIFENWFDGNLEFQKHWLKCGSWKIQENYVCGNDEISFFAKDSLNFIKLSTYLKEFSKTLPNSIIQKGYYKQSMER